MKGKNKCKLLKEIRKAIARENNIEYVTSECKYQGDCSGTCPKCESEVRYLEMELEKRRKAGKAVAVAGIAASMVLSTGCVFNDFFQNNTMGDLQPPESEQNVSQAIQGEAEMVESSEDTTAEIYSQTTGQLVDGEIYELSEFETDESAYTSEEITWEITMGDVLPSEEIVDGEILSPED